MWHFDGVQVKWIHDWHEALERLSQNGNHVVNDGRTITFDGLGFGQLSANTMGHAISLSKKSPFV
jgi:hypothetical protein